jgi:molybdopterin-guanine dinucleotide biosynthesis protein
VIVVVGGTARNAGKTTVICEIIAATREAQWTALKISSHEHEPSDYGDTERYLEAGAARASIVDEYRAETSDRNIIVESNSVMDTLTPDLFVFVDGGGEWKPSALRHSAKAQYTVAGHATPELIADISTGVHREQA